MNQGQQNFGGLLYIGLKCSYFSEKIVIIIIKAIIVKIMIIKGRHSGLNSRGNVSLKCRAGYKSAELILLS